MPLAYWFWTAFFLWILFGVFDVSIGQAPPPKWWPWIGFVLIAVMLLVLGIGEFGGPVKAR